MLAPIAGLAIATFALTACSDFGYSNNKPAANSAQGAAPSAAAPNGAAPNGGVPGGAVPGEAAPPAAPPASAPPVAAPPAAKPQVLKVTQLEGFTPIVTNGKGRTIYRFDNDSNNPATTTCYGGCAKIWEPVLAGSGVRIAGAGIDPSTVGTINRPEGEQVTLNSWPLYYYKNDKYLGQISGYGKNGTWFAIAPNGKKAKKVKVAEGSTTGGYSYGSSY
jgi:predicted lipoprotein with Yx(FWY)xxD motif